MTDKEINEAIAEACRWRCEDTPFERHGTILKGGLAWWHPEIAGARFLPPDYLNDLNAMHEAERVISTNEEMVRYMDNLRGVCGETSEFVAVEVAHLIRATARQRSEAFLRTIGKWLDG